MINYLLRRIALALGSLFVLTILVFASANILPGNPAIAILGRDADPEKVIFIQKSLGLDRPISTRYLDWVFGVMKLDFGNSVTQGVGTFGLSSESGGDTVHGRGGTAVSTLVAVPLKNTGILASISLSLLFLLTIIIGTFSALKYRSKIDNVLQVIGLFFISLPEFVLGAILIVIFSFAIPILPAVSFEVSILGLILPVLTLVLSMLGVTSRLLRVGVIEVLQSNYVITARLRGIPEKNIIRRYLIPNALAPTLQIFAIAAGLFVGGMVVVENLFGYPGIGNGFVNAVAGRDYPVVQAYAIILGSTYIVANLIADLITISTNAKLREAVLI